MSQPPREESLVDREFDADELLKQAAVVRIPMRVRFRGITHREAMLIRGPQGWAEFSPFVEYDDAEASRWLRCAVEAAWSGFPAPVRQAIPVNATLPAVPASQVGAVLDRFPGCQTVKVKVAEPGQSLAQDIERVAAARDYLGASAKVRIDANGGWDVAQARQAVTTLNRWDLEYAEQPVAQVSELAELRVLLAKHGVEVPIAADESIRKAADPYLVASQEAADLIVIKVAPLGGVNAALKIVEGCGLPAVVSSAIDTSVGLAAGVALAVALPQLPYACGLGTAALLGGDVVARPLIPKQGELQCSDARQATQAVDDRLIRQWAAEPERQQWWRARLQRCVALIT